MTGAGNRFVIRSAQPNGNRPWLTLKVLAAAAVVLVLLGQASRAVSNVAALSGPSTVLPARIRAARTFSIVTDVPGTVASVAVSAGDTVKPGQLLVTLENPELQLALEQAEERHRAATARLAGLGRDGELRSKMYTEQHNAATKTLTAAQSRLQRFSMQEVDRIHYELVTRSRQVEELLSRKLATAAELDRSQREEHDALRAVEAAREHRSRLEQEVDAALAQVAQTKMQLDLHRKARPVAVWLR